MDLLACQEKIYLMQLVCVLLYMHCICMDMVLNYANELDVIVEAVDNVIVFCDFWF